MPWRDGARAGRERAEARLGRIAEDWQPARTWVDEHDEPAAPRRLMLGPWGRPALRALGLVVLGLAVVVGYATWRAQPAEVVPAPDVLASGAPITGTVEGLRPGDEREATEPVRAAPTEAAEVIVHVTGWVATPGLVRLPAGSRVADAIEEAGGLTRQRAADFVNLARVVVDGEQIVVSQEAAAAQGPGKGAPDPATSPVIDLNAATPEQLDALPGVGPVLAGRIITWRSTHGRFTSVDELGEVSGIGDAILEQLRPMVRV